MHMHKYFASLDRILWCPRPKQVQNMDDFMQPLADEFNLLWDDAPHNYDAHKKRYSTMRGIIDGLSK